MTTYDDHDPEDAYDAGDKATTKLETMERWVADLEVQRAETDYDAGLLGLRIAEASETLRPLLKDRSLPRNQLQELKDRLIVMGGNP